MANLLSYHDMIERYENGENAFDISVEKWKRIKENVDMAHTPQQFHSILEYAAFKVPLCVEYDNNCSVCPLTRVCSSGVDGSFQKFMRTLQAFCIAGDVLPNSALTNLAEKVIVELEECKEQFKKTVS